MVPLSVFTGSLCTVQKKKKLNGPESITIVISFLKIVKSVKLEGTQGLSPSPGFTQHHPNPVAECCPNKTRSSSAGAVPTGQPAPCPPPSGAEPFPHLQIHFCKAALQLLSSPSLYIQGYPIPGTEFGTALFKFVHLVTAQLSDVSRSLHKASLPLGESAAPPSSCIICKFT